MTKCYKERTIIICMDVKNKYTSGKSSYTARLKDGVTLVFKVMRNSKLVKFMLRGIKFSCRKSQCPKNGWEFY